MFTRAFVNGAVISTTGGLLVLTEIATAVDVEILLSLSVALAVRLWLPTAALPQIKLYGLVRSSPNFVVPLKNSTFVIVPLASVAVAVIVIGAPMVNCELLAGPVIATTGLATLATVITTAVDVVVLF